MQRSLRGVLTVGIALTTLLFGCSEQPSQVSGPQQQPSTGAAPLLTKVPGAEYVPGAYIVVMKDAVADLDAAVDDISARQNITTAFRYQHALKGFAAKLSATEVDALRRIRASRTSSRIRSRTPSAPRPIRPRGVWIGSISGRFR